MKKLTLITKGLRTGTFGVLSQDGVRLCDTVERQWKNNLPNVSCIPAGTYTLKRHQSPKFGQCFALEAPSLGVTIQGPSLRTYCLFHAANKPSELQGCIAPGTSAAGGVVNSKVAMDMLLDTLTDYAYELEIVRL